jgi:hypothetical protein
MKTLTVEIAATATCCVDFIPKVTLKNGILKLDLQETGEECECFCCYEFAFEVEGIKDDKIKIKFRDKDIELSNEKYLTYPIKYKILNGDTINYVNKYGLKQGKWAFFGADSLMNTGHVEFNDDIPVRIVHYHNDKSIKSIESKDENGNYSKYVEYFESGRLKKECYMTKPNTSYKQGLCKEWDEKSQLVYEGDYRK